MRTRLALSADVAERITRRRLLARGGAAAAVLLVGAEPRGAPLTRAQERALRAAVRGPVLTPGDERLQRRARRLQHAAWTAVKPPAVVRVRDSADVRAVVRWAERYDVPLVARSGGHGYNGNSTSATAVVVDLGALDRISYADGIVTLGPGARLLGDVYTALGAPRRRRSPPARARRSRSAGSCSAAGWASPGARWASRSTA